MAVSSSYRAFPAELFADLEHHRMKTAVEATNR
jgi:hypothetical protein